MKLKPYPKYKPSGVEWLGDIPEHWEVKPLKFVCRFAYGDSLATEDREDGDFMVYGSNGPVGTHIVANTKSPVIVIGRKGSYGKLNYSVNPVFSIDTTYFIDNRFTKHSIEWLKYALISLKLDSYSKDSAVPGLGREDAYQNKLTVPPLTDQSIIASYLDRETAKIDELISKKEKLIELLKEKRTALISRAVTKGLNPDVRLKPSGVEWLGDVPEHWEVKSYKRYGLSYETGKREQSDEEFAISVGGEHIQNEKFSLENISYLSAEFYQSSRKGKIKEGDILLVKDGATIGKAMYVHKKPYPKMMVNEHVYRIEANKFIYFVIISENVQSQFWMNNQSTAQESINSETLKNIVFALPPESEQQSIVEYLDRETGKIDALIEKVSGAIEKLKEYRTALISAAVTGKIDVRDIA